MPRSVREKHLILGAIAVQVYKAMRRHVQECAVKILKNVNEDELSNFQRVGC